MGPGGLGPGGASVVGGDGVASGGVAAGPGVALAGVLLTEHLVAHPEVAAHLQVEAALCAGVALGVAEAVVHDAHHLRAERGGVKGHRVKHQRS